MPITQTISFVFQEIYKCFTWLYTLHFRGIPMLGYFIGLAVLGIALDYIFR